MKFLALLLTLLAFAPHPARAAAGAWVESDMVSARLISAVEATGDLAKIPLGLEIKLQKDWKTYWRSPGEAGLPPSIDWKGSSNLADAQMSWPAPHRFTLLGLETYGYKDSVILPISAAPTTIGAALDLRAKLDLLVCAHICVPRTLDLALTLPAGAATPGDEAQRLNQFAAQIPDDGRASGLAIERARWLGTGAGAMLEVDATAQTPFQKPDLFPESETLSFGHPEVTLSEGGRRARIVLPVLKGAASLPRDGLGLTLVDGARAMQARPTLEAAATPGLGARLLALLPMIGLALIGGLILNVMPCVLPVLSIKLLAVASQGGQARGKIRAGFLASAAGILCAFLALALGLIALKLAGGVVGWGIQFQQPLFLVGMVLALTLFACNLAGLFEIALPGILANWLGRAGGDGLAGHFASGAFATLLATPCSAPFLGAAVGFALAGGPLEIMAIFSALGLGLAAPFLLVAAFPGLAARLPRPGRWMVRLKQALSLALLATAMWLLTVVAAQIGLWPALAVGMAMAAIAIVLALGASAPVAAATSLLASVAALAFAATAPALMGAQAGESGPSIHWAAFDDGQIRSQVAQGRIVFVDVTADWCLTCQANKRLVLDDAAIAERLNDPRLTAMRADWTRPNGRIASFLARYNRYGIPFNVIYGPRAPAGIVLPELLTREALLQAMRDAG